MSLIISISVPDGIIFAADSRQTYRNQKNVARIGSETAEKIVLLNDKMCIGIAGLAFLDDNGKFISINQCIEDFISTSADEIKSAIEKNDIAAVPEMLKKYINDRYKWQDRQKNQIEHIKKDLETQKCTNIKVESNLNQAFVKFLDSNGVEKNITALIDSINILFAGYKADESFEVYRIDIPGNVTLLRNSKGKNKEFGASWIGQTDVVTRIILGWDHRIYSLPLINEQLKLHNRDSVGNQLRKLEYNINWGTMTIQDAIDFSRLMIQTTSAIQRFSDGILMNPGDIPGVGGPIDVLVLKSSGPIWINRKEVH